MHPAAGNPDGTLVNALLAHCGQSLSGLGGEARPGIVHRLDKDTSGLIVAAKNDETHKALSAAFEAHDIERAYLALVWGVPSPTAGASCWSSSLVRVWLPLTGWMYRPRIGIARASTSPSRPTRARA